MKNILFLLDYYQENNSANGVCCRNVAECLVKKGYNVFVGCYRPQDAPTEEIQNGVQIIKTWTMPDVPAHKTLKEKAEIYFRWINPFSHRPAAAIRAREEAIYQSACGIIEEKRIDTVVCVHLPSESLLVGRRIKEHYPGVYLCAYQLDTLSGGNLPRFIPQNYTRKRRIAWERYLFQPMDRIILMRASMKHHLCYSSHEAWLDKAVYGDIPLFVPVLNSPVRKCDDGNVRIAFTGTMSEALRTPYHILDVFERLKRYHVNLIIAGVNHCRINNFESYASVEVTELGLIEHERVLELLDDADVLLNIGNINTALIPSKLFEYLSYGKPIITTYWSDADTSLPYLKNYPLALRLDERGLDLNEQAAMVECFFDYCLGKNVDVMQLAELFCENSPDYFEELLLGQTAYKRSNR